MASASTMGESLERRVDDTLGADAQRASFDTSRTLCMWRAHASDMAFPLACGLGNDARRKARRRSDAEEGAEER